MNRKTILYTCWLLVVLTACQPPEKSEEITPPNILILLADDLGYADLGCYGGQARTPHLDRLAQAGIKMTNFYAAAPNCSPSRVGLMTGISPAKLGMYNYRPPNHPIHLQDEAVTLAEMVKPAGYQTLHVGKWHLGCLPQDAAFNHPQPHEQGFDYSLGTENNANPSHLNPVNFVRNGQPVGEMKGYSCQLVVAEAQQWFEQYYNPNQPFFAYLAFHEPHAKVASPPDMVAHYPNESKKDAEYLANVENLDHAIGALLEFLKEKGLFENTFILFSSDNGSYRKASNTPLRAVKSYVYDGGIRVPGIFHYSDILQKQTLDQAAGFVDVLPTMRELIGAPTALSPALDGTNILPILQGKPFERTKSLYWFFYRTSPEIALRKGNWMIMGKDHDTIPRTHQFSAPDMMYIKNMGLVDYELYNLTDDISQQQNRFAEHPDASIFQTLIDNQLQEIQQVGYYWDSLPAPSPHRKIKSEMVKY